MKADSNQDAVLDKQDPSQFNKFQPVELTLTHDQYSIIQHFLPKCFSLLEKKSGKRDKIHSSKFADNENLSRFSAGFDNTEQDQGRSKRNRTKKIDKFLEQETPRVNKRAAADKFQDKFSLDDDINQCMKILTLLKKHPSSYPFLEPVDPERSGASNYLDIIKEPMDFSKIEQNLKSGEYQTATQFHADISKVWHNSYSYNDKTSKIYKLTIDMQKYYKKLTEEGPKKKASKQKSKHKRTPEQANELSIRFDQNRESEQNPRSSLPLERSINESSHNDLDI